MALNNLGLALRQVRRFEEAITAHQDAAAIHQETGDRRAQAAHSMAVAAFAVDQEGVNTYPDT